MPDVTYPGRVIKLGETNRRLVRAIVEALQGFGYPSEPIPKQFDRALAATVKLFQSQHSDTLGRPLKIDGQVGPMTWTALFGAPQTTAAPGSVGGAALDVALQEIGVTEEPLGSNSGPRVDQYLGSVGLAPGNFWCMAFVYFCFQQATAGQANGNPFPRTGGCLEAWSRVRRDSPKQLLVRADAVADPSLIRPGMVFIHDYGSGKGHTGFVRAAAGGALVTVEGNADPQGGRNGLAVLEVSKRSVMDRSLRGFIAF